MFARISYSDAHTGVPTLDMTKPCILKVKKKMFILEWKYLKEAVILMFRKHVTKKENYLVKVKSIY